MAVNAAAASAPDAAALLASLSTTYLTPAAAASTYLTQASASSTYIPSATATGSLAPLSGAGRVPARQSNLTVALGDSITSYDGGDARMNGGHLSQLCVRSMGRFRYLSNEASGGFTLEMIEATHLPTVLAMSPRPGFAIVFGGTNNTGANSGGGAGTGFDFATSKATLTRICDALVKRGITPICVLIPPRAASDTLAMQNIHKWNTWVQRFAQAYGYPILDAYTPLVDPTVGGQQAALTIDGLHPNQAGYRAIVEYNLALDLGSLAPAASSFRVKGAADSSNLITASEALNLTDTNADGTANGWSAVGTSTRSVQNPVTADNLSGKWQRITRVAGVSGDAWVNRSFTGWSIGDRLYVEARVQTSGVKAAGSNWACYVKNTANAAFWGVSSWTEDVADGLISFEFTVPASSTGSMFLYLSCNAATGTDAWAQVGEVTVKNLTVLDALTV